MSKTTSICAMAVFASVTVLGLAVHAENCTCPLSLVMTINAPNGTYYYYFAKRFEASCDTGTSTSMYSSSKLTIGDCKSKTPDCFDNPSKAPLEPMAVAVELKSSNSHAKKLVALEKDNLEKKYEGKKKGNNQLKKLDDFYFKFKKPDGTHVTCHALLHRVTVTDYDTPYFLGTALEVSEKEADGELIPGVYTGVADDDPACKDFAFEVDIAGNKFITIIAQESTP